MRWEQAKASPLAQRTPRNSVCFSPILPCLRARCNHTSSSAWCPLPSQLAMCLKEEKPVSHPHTSFPFTDTLSSFLFSLKCLQGSYSQTTTQPREKPVQWWQTSFFFPLTGHRYNQIEQANETSAGLLCFTNLICLLNTLGFRISENPPVSCLFSLTPPSSPYLAAFYAALS